MKAATRLSSVLRDQGQFEEAVRTTEPFLARPSGALLTTRAAALCDLQRWEQARETLRRAIAIERSPEALAVLARIRAARPDLY